MLSFLWLRVVVMVVVLVLFVWCWLMVVFFGVVFDVCVCCGSLCFLKRAFRCFVVGVMYCRLALFVVACCCCVLSCR